MGLFLNKISFMENLLLVLRYIRIIHLKWLKSNKKKILKERDIYQYK